MSWLEQVREDGLELLNVPEAEKTAALCLEACEQDGDALSRIFP
jgi:hypothetical protein